MCINYMQALCRQWFEQVMSGCVTPAEAEDALTNAGIPLDVQCAALMEAT